MDYPIAHGPNHLGCLVKDVPFFNFELFYPNLQLECCRRMGWCAHPREQEERQERQETAGDSRGQQQQQQQQDQQEQEQQQQQPR